MIGKIVIPVLMWLCAVFRVNCDMNGQEFSTILKTITTNYDKRLRPNFNGDPVKIGMTLHILSIGDLSETSMAFTIDLFLRQYWQDDRLSFNHSISPQSHITIESEFMNTVWTPDVFFINEKSSHFHKYTKPNTFLRFSRSGRVWTSSRYTVVASCAMNLERFPHDVQKCKLSLQSYGYSVEDIVLHLERGEALSLTMAEVVLPQFELLSKDVEHKLEELSSGNYSTIHWEFTFGRRIGYYIIHVYLPCTALVIISFMVFWFPQQYFGDRIALGVSTMLTITVLISSVNTNMPKFSYVKALDFYLLTCFVSCFFSLTMSALNAKSAKAYDLLKMTKKVDDSRTKKSDFQENFSDLYRNTIEEELIDKNDKKADKPDSVTDRNGYKAKAECKTNIEMFNKGPKKAGSMKNSPKNSTSNKTAKKFVIWEGAKATLFSRPKNVIAVEDAYINCEATKLDKFCRIAFPAFYILFTIIYWLIFKRK